MSILTEIAAALGVDPGAVAAPVGGTLYGPPLPDPQESIAAGSGSAAPQVVALPAVNVAAGQQLVNLPPLCREGGELRVANNGPYDLVVTFGGFSRNLTHGLLDVWKLPPESLQLTVTATLAPGQSAGAATLNLDYAYPGEHFEGTYPQVIGAGTIQVAGNVAVTATNVTVENVPGTKLTSARPAQSLGIAVYGGAPTTVNFALPADVQGLVLNLPNPLGNYKHIKLAWHSSTGNPPTLPQFELYVFPQAIFVIPITPTLQDLTNTRMNSIDVTIDATSPSNDFVEVIALFESAPLWLEMFPLPQLEANQFPVELPATVPTGGGWSDVVAPVANVELLLFEIWLSFVSSSMAAANTIMFGRGPDAAHVTEFTAFGVPTQNAIPQAPPSFSGAPMGRGNGLFVSGVLGAGINGHVVISKR